MCHCCAGMRQWPLPQARGPAERDPALTTLQAHQPALTKYIAQVLAWIHRQCIGECFAMQLTSKFSSLKDTFLQYFFEQVSSPRANFVLS